MNVGLRMAGKDSNTAGSSRSRNQEQDPFLPGSTVSASPGSLPLDGGQRRILVVDDNAVVLKAFETKLASRGFKVSTTADANTVVGAVASSKAELMILDINFPPAGNMEWNGFTVMQWMRRFPELKKLPVILISGECGAEYKEKALAAGAVGFFQKPFDFEELFAAIRKALG